MRLDMLGAARSSMSTTSTHNMRWPYLPASNLSSPRGTDHGASDISTSSIRTDTSSASRDRSVVPFHDRHSMSCRAPTSHLGLRPTLRLSQPANSDPNETEFVSHARVALRYTLTGHDAEFVSMTLARCGGEILLIAEDRAHQAKGLSLA